jgi:hypothetical protein
VLLANFGQACIRFLPQCCMLASATRRRWDAILVHISARTGELMFEEEPAVSVFSSMVRARERIPPGLSPSSALCSSVPQASGIESLSRYQRNRRLRPARILILRIFGPTGRCP